MPEATGAARVPHRMRMRVEGMTCPSCEHHVEEALRETGAIDVAADFRRGDVVFTMNEVPDADLLAQVVGRSGYEATGLEKLHQTPQEPELVQYSVAVRGMTCADCERHVVEAASGCRGIQSRSELPARRRGVLCASRC